MLVFSWLLGIVALVLALTNVLRLLEFQSKVDVRRREFFKFDTPGVFGPRFRFVLLIVSVAGPCYTVLGGDDVRTGLAAAISLLVGVLWHVLLQDALDNPSIETCEKRMSRTAMTVRTAIMVVASASLAAFFFATNAVIAAHKSTLKDATLLRIDELLLGWLFPRGQVSLWVDHQAVIGPQTVAGAVITDALTMWYVSYYAWGYLVMVVLLVRAIWTQRKAGPFHEAAAWRAVEALMSAWILSFLITFLLNTFFPAVSPRLFLKDEYTHPLKGLGFREWMSGAIHQDNTFGSFPSGHVGETVAVGLAALRLGATPRVSRLVIFAAGVIGIATVWLRYHYFVDVLVAIAVATFAVWLSGASREVAKVAELENGLPAPATVLLDVDVTSSVKTPKPVFSEQVFALETVTVDVKDKTKPLSAEH